MTISARSIEATSAVTENITPYQVITMLLDGSLERVGQAISCLDEGEIDEAAVLVQKTIAIVSGLRESLNIKSGGEIASNLDMLYEYIVAKLDTIGHDKFPIAILNEVHKLLSEVQEGWTGIAQEVN
ncbi:MAG: flagellar protein FliS [Cellvibrionaceae bacterium]|jgi:flagellar protein FliS